MRGKRTGMAALLLWCLALLFCAAVLLGRARGAQRLRRLQEAVYGICPEQVEEVIGALRDGGAMEAGRFFAD